MIILLMGVAGSGKTTVGHALAQQLGWRFADADDFHSAANVARMSAGIPLTDEDRGPWLQSLHNAIVQWLDSDQNVILACSALKSSYRELLVVSADVKLVYLHGSQELIAQRMAARTGHYMNPHLLRSQFEALEEPHGALTVDAGMKTEQIVLQIRQAVGV